MSESIWWLAQVAMPALGVLAGVAILLLACVTMVANAVSGADTWRIAGAGAAVWASGITWGWLVNHGARTLMMAR